MLLRFDLGDRVIKIRNNPRLEEVVEDIKSDVEICQMVFDANEENLVKFSHRKYNDRLVSALLTGSTDMVEYSSGMIRSIVREVLDRVWDGGEEMRSADTLKDLGDVGILLQYLYSDENRVVTYSRQDDVITEYELYDNLSILKTNIVKGERLLTKVVELHPDQLITLIKYQKSMPSNYPERFKNKWEEIVEEVKSILYLNR